MYKTKITDRDIRLLIDLFENSFLSLYQIRQMHFKNCARSTIYNRLSKLIKSNLIESMRVNLNAIHRNNEDIGAIYFITKAGLDLVSKYHKGEFLRNTPVPINLSQLHHDLVLTDLIFKLRNNYNEARVLNSRVQVNSYKEERQVPDGVILFKDKKYALEVELTAKSNLRYREIVSNYRTSFEYDRVLYLVKNESIRKKMGGIITGFGKDYKLSDDTDKFYFCTITDFFHGHKNFRFCNGNNNLGYNFRSNQETMTGVNYEL